MAGVALMYRNYRVATHGHRWQAAIAVLDRFSIPCNCTIQLNFAGVGVQRPSSRVDLMYLDDHPACHGDGRRGARIVPISASRPDQRGHPLRQH
jgi:hypothetical protein